MVYLEMLHEIAKDNDLKSALMKISEFDMDFSGQNGDEYLLDIAKEKGYSSDAEYFADLRLKEYKNHEAIVSAFLRDMFTTDPFYYVGYKWELIRAEDGEHIVVAVMMQD